MVKNLEVKIVAARKAVIAKNKSVYFGSITDEQLKLAARHSEDPEILAMIFRSKSHLKSCLTLNERNSD